MWRTPVISFLLLLGIVCRGILSQGQDFEVSPTRLTFAVEPGNIQTQKVIIRNHEEKKQAFVLHMSDQTVDSSGNRAYAPPGTTSRSLAKWLTINPSFFELNPHSEIEVGITLQVPSDGYSSRWATIFVRATREQTSAHAEKVIAASIHITPQIAIRVYQSPPSNTKYKAIISDFKEITKPKDTIRSFSVLVNNIGDKSIAARVSLIASDVQTGREYKIGAPIKSEIYPDESRQVKLPLLIKLPAGTFSLAAILDYGHNTPLEAAQLLIEIK